jgi:hypothetical protein
MNAFLSTVNIGFKHHEMFQLFKPNFEAVISYNGNNFGLGATLALVYYIKMTRRRCALGSI